MGPNLSLFLPLCQSARGVFESSDSPEVDPNEDSEEPLFSSLGDFLRLFLLFELFNSDLISSLKLVRIEF